jgi:hypothetical protein
MTGSPLVFDPHAGELPLPGCGGGWCGVIRDLPRAHWAESLVTAPVVLSAS